jgi:hypothetical protein
MNVFNDPDPLIGLDLLLFIAGYGERWAYHMKSNRYLTALFICFVSHVALSAEREFLSIDEFIGTFPANHGTQVRALLAYV